MPWHSSSDDWWDLEAAEAKKNAMRSPPQILEKIKPKSAWSLPTAVGKLALDAQKYPALGEHVRLPPPDPLPVPVLDRHPASLTEPPVGKKSAQKPVLDLGVLLEHSSIQQREKKARAALHAAPGTGPAPVKAREAAAIANALDASAPTRMRGKERETAKPKKPSTMKKAVLTSRKQNQLAKAEEQIPESLSAMPTATLDGAISSSTIEPKKCLHSKRFAPYCDQIVTPEIDQLVGLILEAVAFYQDRAFRTQDPTKFKKRFVCGLRDVRKNLERKEIRLVILAPDVEVTEQPNGPDALLLEIKEFAKEHDIPVLFAMKRKSLAKKCHKPGTVSVVGLINYDVAAADVRKVLQLAEEASQKYRSLQESSGIPVEVTPADVVQNGPMRLYVGSLHFNITEAMLKDIFEPFGKLDSVQLAMDPESGRSKEYAFISFRDAHDAKRAMEQLNGFVLAGRAMKIGHVTDRNDNATQGSLNYDDTDPAGFDLGPTGR
ncbi:selenocysteine insertion sequence-binding protein 2-like isoform X2 [Paramacrobiotus metropolitanus]|uniref:selenocysteine insertion sequence-binding protein 2-like isoform X2 n=1 Tax=Paramacrobiotus metropolitanus TaxID=2943436 RepID=UPI00244656EA|nr:selenocysteine insertion sequence-binding protein 2-like isoform X2 [Paramacrobiotus metropolitanus]